MLIESEELKRLIDKEIYTRPRTDSARARNADIDFGYMFGAEMAKDKILLLEKEAEKSKTDPLEEKLKKIIVEEERRIKDAKG